MSSLTQLRAFAASLLIAAASVAWSQQAPQSATNPDAATPSAATSKQPSKADGRRAAKLYLDASKLYEKQRFEDALRAYEQAAQLDSTVANYRLAIEVARSHAVTALMQAAAQQRSRGDLGQARAALMHALELDPGNKDVLERLQQAGGIPEPSAERPQSTPEFGGLEHIAPSEGVRNFHLRSNARQVIQQVFKAWGIEATVDESVRTSTVRLDLENATFDQAAHAVSMLTDSFFVPIDAHRLLVARDTRELRQQYTRLGTETLPLSGFTTTEMTDMANLARNVFEISQAAVNPTAATITLRGPEKSLLAFNATYDQFMKGRGEVLVDVKILQVAHTNDRNTGIQPTQQIGVFNVLAEAKSVIQQNQDLVQQIIASGLAGPNDYAKILAILIASGQVSNTVLTSGWVEFGGSCNLSTTGSGACSPWAFGASPGKTTINLNLNSSESREIENFRLRLQDGEEGTLKNGSRYPIQTSSYSSLSSNSLNIPGLNNAGNSSALAGLLGGLGGATPNIPQVQYEDLGLTLKTRPRIMRSGDVALTVDLKISSLAGGSLNGVPVLANRAYAGVVTLPANESVVIAGEIDKTESRALSGFPGLSDIPGLNDVTNKMTQRNYATMLIILTPHVVRNPIGSGHSPMVPVDKSRR